MKLSIIIISFKSDHLLKKLLIKFPKKHQIIIVENSKSKKIKKYEKKFKNVKVIFPEENLGYAKAFNLASKNCKNNFLLTMTPDVIIDKKLIKSLEILLQRFKDFTLLAPEYKNLNIYKNYTPLPNSQSKKINLSSFVINKAKEIDWCFCIINKKKIKKSKILDENYFMYFETIDLCKELIKKNHNFYTIQNLKFSHLGTSSTKKIYNNEILVNRNWHFSWSKFYFFKKNNNYLFAFKKILPNIYQGILGILISILRLNIFHIRLHLASLSGILNGILLRKSLYRPKIK